MYMRTSECSCKKRRRKKLREQETHSRYVRELLDFIEKSPGCFHLTANMAWALTQAGYVRLYERKPWEVRPGREIFCDPQRLFPGGFRGYRKKRWPVSVSWPATETRPPFASKKIRNWSWKKNMCGSMWRNTAAC